MGKKSDNQPHNIILSDDAEKKLLKQQKKSQNRMDKAERSRLSAEEHAINAERRRADEQHRVEMEALKEREEMENFRTFVESMGGDANSTEIARMYLQHKAEQERLKKEEEKRKSRNYNIGVAIFWAILILVIIIAKACGGYD